MRANRLLDTQKLKETLSEGSDQEEGKDEGGKKDKPKPEKKFMA